MVDWATVVVAAPGWGLTTYALLALVGKAPVRLRRWDRDRIEDEHAKIVQAQQLAAIAPLADTLTSLAEKSDLILAAINANGGASLRDAVDRIEKKLDDHIGSSDKVEAAIYDQMAEQGHEIDALTRKVRDLFNKRGEAAS